jgi:hypothetical protein
VTDIGIIPAKRYFGWEVVLYKSDWKDDPYPWTFAIRKGGVTLKFLGIPNRCATSRSALKRAWYRCKWKKDGSYEKRYR